MNERESINVFTYLFFVSGTVLIGIEWKNAGSVGSVALLEMFENFHHTGDKAGRDNWRLRRITLDGDTVFL